MTHVGEVGFVVVLWVAWGSAIVAIFVNLVRDLFREPDWRNASPMIWFFYLLMVLALGFLVIWLGPGWTT